MGQGQSWPRPAISIPPVAHSGVFTNSSAAVGSASVGQNAVHQGNSFIKALPTGAVSVPGCQAVAPPQTTLDNVTTAQISVPSSPFGLAYAQDDTAFVSIGNTLGVLNTSSFTPRLIHQISLPEAYVGVDGGVGPLGLASTHDGQHLLAAAGPGAVIVDVPLAISGSSDAVVGTLNGTTAGEGAIEVAISSDNNYAFISQEFGPVTGKTRGNIAVFKLNQPNSNATVSGKADGYQSLGYSVVGTSFSPDGTFLYATSKEDLPGSTTSTQGSLSVINVQTLEANPSNVNAIVSNVTAGCGPVRNIASSDGKTVWVAAQESNHLLAFDTQALLFDPANALKASVQVGTSPVGLTFARNESRILTADSNRFNYTSATSGISVVDVQAALAGKPAVLGRIPTGPFPRGLVASPDGSVVLVADYSSKQIQAIDVSSLP